jgi:S-adenosylmethionine synthetase
MEEDQASAGIQMFRKTNLSTDRNSLKILGHGKISVHPIDKRNLREGRKHPAVQGVLLIKPSRIPLPVIWRCIAQGG